MRETCSFQPTSSRAEQGTSTEYRRQKQQDQHRIGEQEDRNSSLLLSCSACQTGYYQISDSED